MLDTSRDYSHWFRDLYTPWVGDTAAGWLSGDNLLPSIGRVIDPTITDREGIQLPQLEGSENAGMAERFTRGVVSFAVPYVSWAKAVGVVRSASWLGRIGRGLLAGSAVDFTQVDPVSGNVANALRDGFGLESRMLDALASEEDDGALEQRTRAAIAGAPLGLVADGVMELGVRGVRAYRAWKGTSEEAAGIVDSLRADIGLNPNARSMDDAVSPEATAKAADAADTATASGGRKGESAAAPKGRGRAKQPPPEDFDDVLEYLKRAAGDPQVAEADAAKFARNLLYGDPENALAKIGIDPVKLDYSKFDNPEMLGRFQVGMAELYETYARGLGRSNLRVTEASTASAARAFATTADVLKELHGSTSNLAERLMGARMFVGSHAHKLIAQADEAIAEINAGGAGTKWIEFLESFHRHAYFLGAVRGAGSEVGRALRSLQSIAKVSKAKAAQSVEKALDGEVVDSGASIGVNRVAADASDYAARLTTDADKLLALAELKRLQGDVGELSRHVRRENNSVLRRIDSALKETVGNLFSPATAVYNIASGGVMLGSRVLTRSMSSLARLALVPFGGREAGVAARMAFIDTWAYTHGIVSGFGEASSNMLKVLEKEGAAEVSLNADSLGLRTLATRAAGRSAKASDELGQVTFERADVKNYRSFAITASERARLTELSRSLPGPKFFQEGLAALSRVAAVNTNVLGSLSRMGTTLFINMPDEFIGTLAARAGAYSHAVRTAANEAAELGLEGKDLSAYLKARAVQLAEHPPGWHPDGYDAGVREAMGNVGEREAREVLFQDDLELTADVSRFLTSIPLMHMVVPFVKTPLRILERTAIDYTPLGLVKDRVRKAIIAGGPERDEALARLSLGILAVSTAYALADDRQIVGNDGGYTSSARMGRPSYSLKVGDDVYEFSRIDPLGTLLGMGADMRAYFRSQEDDPNAPGVVQQVTEAFLWGVSMNMLSKTWLESLRNLTELAGATSDEHFSSRMTVFLKEFAPRFVPASGIQRQLEKAGGGFLRQAFTFSDELLKGSFGADTLPLRRDGLLGRPIPLDGLDRLIGLRGGVATNEADDPLAYELERLSFKLPSALRTIEGVKLNASQFSRYLELKGQIVVDPRTGLTLEEALERLIRLPEYRQMTDPGRIAAIRNEMEGYSRLAVDQLVREDTDFAYEMLREETRTQAGLEGWDSEERDARTRKLALELGLLPVDQMTRSEAGAELLRTD
ncbi:hypothetical protein P1X14_11135 [Sphingomonas sp. AOB5]|uniref:hypothetical protein n=1 Tax=Sphingomonas sp. AOB5 TaxID=3034017 RepID=UPI0023F7CF6C|nr:hypothetical protein [Sphingomonas sp. AOB5]MDF7775801.1 hypothetical protein [Sphingomonas sp. AOB5]